MGDSRHLGILSWCRLSATVSWLASIRGDLRLSAGTSSADHRLPGWVDRLAPDPVPSLRGRAVVRTCRCRTSGRELLISCWVSWGRTPYRLDHGGCSEGDLRRRGSGPRWPRVMCRRPARAEPGNPTLARRVDQRVGRSGTRGGTPEMHERGTPDGPIVPIGQRSGCSRVGRVATPAGYRVTGGKGSSSGPSSRCSTRFARRTSRASFLRVPAGVGAPRRVECVDGRVISKRVSWVLDADIRDFFGQLDHDWPWKSLGHRTRTNGS
jgi:hypothetical protein